MEIHVRRLQPEDDRAAFTSGDPDLDRFFHRFAGQNQFRHHIGTTYVAVVEGSLAGYATLAASHIEGEAVPAKLRRRLPDYPLPTLRLARLAVDERFGGRGVGLTLLRSVFDVAIRMKDELGCIGVVVDAKPGAVPFYQRFGFVILDTLEGRLGERPEPVVMFLAMGGIPSP
ncbi:MAG TPA: GNAT family N-acetyltransferase [Actinomycetota bacterium]